MSIDDLPPTIPSSIPLPPSIVLTRPLPADAAVIAHNGALSFLTDTHTELKSYFHGKDNFEQGSLDHLASLQDNPRVDQIVARDVSPSGQGKVVGWICWAKRGYDITDPITTINDSAPPSQPPVPDKTPLKIGDLEDLTNKSMTDYMTYYMPPRTKCRYIIGTNVHPDYQGQKIGTALLKWGTDLADQDGVFCWVQSSMGAVRAYEKSGFRETGRMEYNLNDFAEGKMREGYEGEEGMGWGGYTWVYMRRMPGGK